MQPLSVAMMVLNEEDRIVKCLESVSWAHEIVVVDSGSSDRTVEICQSYGAKVVLRPFDGHVSQREFSIRQTSHEWVLTIDADEALSGELIDEIKTILTADKIEQNGFMIPRHNYYMGRLIRRGSWGSDANLRLFKKSAGKVIGINPHDKVQVTEPVGRLKGPMRHYSYRDLRDQAERLVKYSWLSAQHMRSLGRRAKITDLVLHAPYAFFKEYILKRGWMDGTPGLIIAAMDSYYTFLKYARLWEIQSCQNKESEREEDAG